MTDNGSKIVPPQPGAGDTALTVAKAVVSAVPIVGSPVAELLDLVRSPLQRRRDEWFRDLAERLAQLEGQGRLTRERLASDEFLDAVARGVQAASRTGDSDKRAALRNAALNVALATTPDEGERELFLGMVERFTPWHLRMLKTMQDPETTRAKATGRYRSEFPSSRGALLEAVFPELKDKSAFYEAVWAALVSEKLVWGGIEEPPRAAATTPLGNRFLSFIEKPVART